MIDLYLIKVFQQPGVAWIYATIYFCLAIQLTLFFTVISSYKKSSLKLVFQKMRNFSEWAINVPPTLGVLGTIIAMAIAIGGKSAMNSPEEFMKTFMQNFQSAVTTTVLGGIVYTINLLLSSFMEMFED